MASSKHSTEGGDPLTVIFSQLKREMDAWGDDGAGLFVWDGEAGRGPGRFTRTAMVGARETPFVSYGTNEPL